MYFPYLRGRQYELLALRELVDANAMSDNIIPIIEPVKLSSTLLKTMDSFIKNKKRMIIICNPAVGDFSSDMKNGKDINKTKFLDLLKDKSVMKGHIIKNNSTAFIDKWHKIMNVNKQEWVVINNNIEYQNIYNEIFGNAELKYVFIPDESAFRRQIRKNRVMLEDRFKKRTRNSDYIDNEDEFYSSDHLFYREDGYLGFSDYSIIGDDYLESGFAPYAVAIHIVYFDKEKNLRVHHFVSDSNEDIQNPAKKFYEAVTKLIKWSKAESIKPTMGLKTFMEHYKNLTYPGLGSVKKLSLMHHIELMGSYLDEV